jgi:hypothetical protein
MNLHVLHNLSGIAIVLSLILKIAIHYYLEHLRDRSLGFSSIFIMPLQYLMPYKSSATGERNRLKYLCNGLIVLAYVSLLLNVFFGLLML